jgi:hypothetical protein
VLRGIRTLATTGAHSNQHHLVTLKTSKGTRASIAEVYIVWAQIPDYCTVSAASGALKGVSCDVLPDEPAV